MRQMRMFNRRRGFTLLLGYVVVLLVVFAALFAQTHELSQLLAMQKKALAFSGILIETRASSSKNAEKAPQPSEPK